MSTGAFLIGIDLAYLIAASAFILGIKRMSSPRTAKSGNFLAAIGMLIAIVVTLLHQDIVDYRLIGIGIAVGTVIGLLTARLVAMTAMPQMVAVFNGFGGLASALVGRAYRASRRRSETMRGVARRAESLSL